ncbi:battenin CLN3 protein [Rhodotorula toruloides]
MRSQLTPAQSSSAGVDKRTRNRLCWANFLFGTLNNIIYVVILSAALDLVDKASTPKGIILLVNITPALLVKIGWPYFVPGPPQYGKRVAWCSGISFAGIIIVATSSTLLARLFGIALASFSSGLGEMTFLQKATLYGALSVPEGEDYGGTAVGWFSSGTGAAGIGGAGLWWVVRGLGVRTGLLICSVLPLAMSASYFLLLPPLTAFRSHSPFSVAPSTQAYSALPADSSSPASSDSAADDDEELDEQHLEESFEKRLPALTTGEKIELARPLVRRYMVPLFLVYLAEYTINSGIAPTLLYKVPTKEDAPVLALVINSLRDFYPLWQLLYQTFVFVSRSSISILHIPPLPLRLLPLPTALQLVILLLTTLEASASFLVTLLGEHGATWIVAGLICCEGLCGGAAYVNAFHRLATEEGQDEGEHEEEEGFLGKDRLRMEQEKEFRIASVGYADTLGICCASLLSTLLEPRLCASQVARGRLYCRQLD